MPDLYDAAQELQQREIDEALARRKQVTRDTLLECADCGREIPEERRLAVPGACRCVACQSIFESEKARR